MPPRPSSHSSRSRFPARSPSCDRCSARDRPFRSRAAAMACPNQAAGRTREPEQLPSLEQVSFQRPLPTTRGRPPERAVRRTPVTTRRPASDCRPVRRPTRPGGRTRTARRPSGFLRQLSITRTARATGNRSTPRWPRATTDGCTSARTASVCPSRVDRPSAARLTGWRAPGRRSTKRQRRPIPHRANSSICRWARTSPRPGRSPAPRT